MTPLFLASNLNLWPNGSRLVSIPVVGGLHHRYIRVAALRKKGVQVGKISEEQWGARTTISLPGGGAIGLYEPKHPVTFEKNFSKKKTGQTNRPKK